jgi:hypothetical protein
LGALQAQGPGKCRQRFTPIKDAIFAKLLKREQEHVGADTGVGVLIKIERAQDIRGNPIE